MGSLMRAIVADRDRHLHHPNGRLSLVLPVVFCPTALPVTLTCGLLVALTDEPMALRAAVFLITFSGLMFEIGLTRIYSATIWYHFTFVAVSVALLGWGLGGLAVHLTKRRFVPSFEKAATLTMLYA